MKGVCTVSAALKGPEHYDNIIVYCSHNVEGTEPKLSEPGKLGPACFSENVVNLSDTEERKYLACLLLRRMIFKTHTGLIRLYQQTPHKLGLDELGIMTKLQRWTNPQQIY